MKQYDRDYIFGFLRGRKHSITKDGNYAISLRPSQLDIIPYFQRTINLQRYNIEKANRIGETYELEDYDHRFVDFAEAEDFGDDLLNYHSFLPFFRGFSESKAVISKEHNMPLLSFGLGDDRLLRKISEEILINTGATGWIYSLLRRKIYRVRGDWKYNSFVAVYEYLYGDGSSGQLGWLKEKMEECINTWQPTKRNYCECAKCGRRFVLVKSLSSDMCCIDCSNVKYQEDKKIGFDLLDKTTLLLGD